MGMMYAMGTPIADPKKNAIKIHWYWTTSNRSSVPTTASSMPISPIITPRRAVAGEFIHLMARMNDMAASMYRNGSSVSSSFISFLPVSFLFRLPFLEHFQHAVGDEIAADYVEGRQQHCREAQNTRQRAGVLRSGDQNRADHRDGRDRVGQRHQRRMQQRRHAAYQLKS